MRNVGVEEELLLLDEQSGAPVAVGWSVLDRSKEQEMGEHVQVELQQEQIELDTRPQERLDLLGEEVRRMRDLVDQSARESGARAAAIATSPLAVEPSTTTKSRYLRMSRQFQMVEQGQLTCGAHVHVAVESGEEAVAVLDRIRVWLPLLTAMSANSPFWKGRDSGYASYRSQVWGRWPSAGPTEVHGSEQAYRNLVRDMLGTGVLLDEGMVYFDARLSRSYPTLEIRVADVCLYAADMVLLAGLSRALVDTASARWRQGEPPQQQPAAVLRLASWRASRSGLGETLIHPEMGRPVAAGAAIGALVRHVGDALRDNGDEELVNTLLAELLDRGNGADRQRATFAAQRSLRDVAIDAIALTHGDR